MNRSTKITALIFGLLTLMFLSQYVTKSSLEDITANRPYSNSTRAKKEPAPKHGSVKLPDPTGPASAPVKIKVYLTSDNSCDTTTMNGMKKISAKYGDKVRLEFVDLLKKDVAAQAQDMKISCKSGLSINGMSIMHIPGHGVKGLVMFDGPIDQKNYGFKDVDAAVAQLLQSKPAKGTSADKSGKSS
jgi:hypothetical protein